MNHEPRFPDPHDEMDAREWSAQERALADERAGHRPEAGEPPLRTYRLMAHLLAQPPDEQLPPDFARQTARRVERAAAAARPADTRFERNLLALLVVALIGAGLLAVVLYGTAWLPSLDQGAAGAVLSKPWLWALAACMALSGLCDRWWLRNDLPV
jgi:hypothetical protein